MLVDYDPASNIGGWQWAASTGTDAVPYFFGEDVKVTAQPTGLVEVSVRQQDLEVPAAVDPGHKAIRLAGQLVVPSLGVQVQPSGGIRHGDTGETGGAQEGAIFWESLHPST